MNAFVLFGVALTLAGAPPARETPRSILDLDRRLVQPVHRPAASKEQPVTVGRLLEAVYQQLGVEITAAGPLLSVPVAPEVEGKTAKAILTEVARRAGARWERKKGGLYVLRPLTPAEKHAQEVAEDLALGRVYRDLAASLTAGQRQKLKSGEVLPFEQLGAGQKQLFLQALWAVKDEFGPQIHADALAGHGGQIALTPVFSGDLGAAAGPPQWEMHLLCPMQDADEPFAWMRPFAMLPPEMSPGLGGRLPITGGPR